MALNKKIYKYTSLVVVDNSLNLKAIVSTIKNLRQTNLEGLKNNIEFYKEHSRESLQDAIVYLEKSLDKSDILEDKESFIKQLEEMEADCLKQNIENEEKECLEVLNKNVSLLFDLSALGTTKEVFESIGNVLVGLKKEKIKYNNVSFQLLDKNADISGRMPTILTKAEFDMLKNLEERLKQKGLVENITIQEGIGGNPFTINQVERANKVIDIVANKIKNLKLSPFEAVVYVHDFCSNFYYNSDNFDFGSRTLTDVVESGNIVCVGYATMFQAIIEKLNISEIKSGLNFAASLEDELHANNLVYIKDNKYQIDGVYIEDSCWDSPKMIEKEGSLTYCLYPIEDINFMQTRYKYSKNGNMQAYNGIKVKGDLIEKIDREQRRENLIKEHKKYLDSINKKGSPIDLECYAKAYYEILVKQGVSKEKAKKQTEEKINNSIAVAKYNIDYGCLNSFYKDVSEEFLLSYIDEITLLESRLVSLKRERENLHGEDLKKNHELYWEIKDKLVELTTNKESVGNEVNRRVFQDVLSEKE